MSELLSQFGINWVLLVAQMINFAVLVWVLAKFVYRPVIRKLDERREKIENSLMQAKALDQKSLESEAEYAAHIAKAREEAQEIMTKAKEAAAAMQKQAQDNALRQSDNLLLAARREAQDERDAMLKDMQKMVVESSTAIVEKIIREKLDPPTREKLVHEAINDLPSSKGS